MSQTIAHPDRVRVLRTLERRLGGRWTLTPFGPSGLRAQSSWVSVLVTTAPHEDGHEWIHASIARNTMPSYEDLCVLKEAAFGPELYAFQVFPPVSEHVNIHEHCLHLWGRADGVSPLPNFAMHGTI